MFMIDGKNQQEGGQIVFEKCYRLKHLSSGCYLSVVLNESNESTTVNLNKNKSTVTLPPLKLSNVKSIENNDKNTLPSKIKNKGTYILKLSTVADDSTLFTFF